MVAEVNKIIAGELLSHRAVVIPGVGTLFVAHRSARRLSRRKIAAPRNEVDFRSSEEEVSLVELIRRTAGCDEVQAQAIFDRWLAKTREGEVLTIEGVGVLRHHSFTPDAGFAAQLNPAGDEIVTLRPRMNRLVVGIAVAAIVVALGLFGYMEFGPKSISRLVARSERSVTQTRGQSASVKAEKSPSSEETVDGITAAAVAVEESHSAEQPAEQPQAVGRAATAAPNDGKVAAANSGIETKTRSAAAPRPASDRLQPGWCYVVFGVFSTEENALRCREKLSGEAPSLAVAVYPFGAKFMVAPYAAAEREACERFVREHRTEWPDLWIYAKK